MRWQLFIIGEKLLVCEKKQMCVGIRGGIWYTVGYVEYGDEVSVRGRQKRKKV